MAWTSSAARRDGVRLAGAADRSISSGHHPALAEAGSQGWLRLATLLHLAVLAAAIPLGSEIGIVALTVGSVVTLLIISRDGTGVARAARFPGFAPEITSREEPTVAGTVPSTAAPLAAPPRPADIVWREIMGQISHELRTPLNAIIGFSDLMGRELYGPVGDPRYQEYLGHIRDSGRSLLKSAEDTLTLTELLAQRGGDHAPAVIEVEDLVLGAIARAAGGSSPAEIHFDRHCARGLDIQGERRALHQSLSNVITEALERMGAQRQQMVSITVREAGGRVLIDIAAPMASAAVDGPSLRMALARMMLELNGASLDEAITAAGWRATVGLDLVGQPDLFRA